MITESMWYLARNRQRYGPISWSKLVDMSFSGQLDPNEFILQVGTRKWIAASTIAGLFAPQSASNVGSAATHKIFISYRRDDSADVTGRIYERLVGHFGVEQVVRDVDSIPLGTDFRGYIADAVKGCRVLLAVIGKTWLDALNQRMNDPHDFVRIEIESALERGIPVIPVLVQDAPVPNETQLPLVLQDLSYRNGLHVRRDPDFHRDMDHLIKELNRPIEQVRKNQLATAGQRHTSQGSAPPLHSPPANPVEIGSIIAAIILGITGCLYGLLVGGCSGLIIGAILGPLIGAGAGAGLGWILKQVDSQGRPAQDLAWILAGYVFMLTALFLGVYSGIPGVITGIVNKANGRHVHGVLQISGSITFAMISIAFGLAHTLIVEMLTNSP